MTRLRSRITAQGQISIPAAVRERLGLQPGRMLEWELFGDHAVVRGTGKYSSLDIHRALFPEPPRRRSLAELKEGPAKYVRERHARGRY